MGAAPPIDEDDEDEEVDEDSCSQQDREGNVTTTPTPDTDTEAYTEQAEVIKALIHTHTQHVMTLLTFLLLACSFLYQKMTPTPL